MEPSCKDKKIMLIIMNKTYKKNKSKKEQEMMAEAFKVNKLINKILKGNLEKRKLQAQDLPI